MEIITETGSQTLTPKTLTTKHRNGVFRNLVSANPRLKVILFSVEMSFTQFVVVYRSRLFKLKTERNSINRKLDRKQKYKTEIQILANPRLTLVNGALNNLALVNFP